MIPSDFKRNIGLLRRCHLFNKEYMYLSPHFHVVGYGYLMQSDEFHEATKAKRGKRDGWVYKWIRNIGDDADLMGLLKYMFSHSALIGKAKEGMKSNGSIYRKFPIENVTYQGDLAYRSLKSELIGSKMVEIPCPICDKPAVEWYGWDQEPAIDPITGQKTYDLVWTDKARCGREIVTNKVERWRYHLRRFPDRSVVMIRGDDTWRKIELLKKNPVEIHRHHVFDHVARQWIDENGNVVPDQPREMLI